jgi:hypothetical protein
MLTEMSRWIHCQAYMACEKHLHLCHSRDLRYRIIVNGEQGARQRLMGAFVFFCSCRYFLYEAVKTDSIDYISTYRIVRYSTIVQS